MFRILLLSVPEETVIVGFAYDIVIVAKAKHLKKVDAIVVSKAALISSRKKKGKIRVKVGIHVIKSKESTNEVPLSHD